MKNHEMIHRSSKYGEQGNWHIEQLAMIMMIWWIPNIYILAG